LNLFQLRNIIGRKSVCAHHDRGQHVNEDVSGGF
jgi:hypothetical protein